MTMPESMVPVGELPPYAPEYRLPEKLNDRVQRVSSGLVAKFPRGWEYLGGTESSSKPLQFRVGSESLQSLVHELQMLTKAYQAGISVPKSEGLFVVPKQQHGLVNQMLRRKILTPAILMQYIPGTTINRLPPDLYLNAQKLRDEEREKAVSLGFKTYDLHSGNVIYNPLEKKVYLIDLEMWQRS